MSRRKQLIDEYFDTAPWDEDWNPRFSIAPTQQVPVVRQHPKKLVRELTVMKWGLIPNWSKSPSIAASTINARSKTAADKPAFRDPLKYRRCLIPADAFYEWKRNGSSKRPYCFEVDNGELFAFAGLWDGCKDRNGNWIRSCTIMTTTPNVVTGTVHDRTRRYNSFSRCVSRFSYIAGRAGRRSFAQGDQAPCFGKPARTAGYG